MCRGWTGYCYSKRAHAAGCSSFHRFLVALPGVHAIPSEIDARRFTQCGKVHSRGNSPRRAIILLSAAMPSPWKVCCRSACGAVGCRWMHAGSGRASNVRVCGRRINTSALEAVILSCSTSRTSGCVIWHMCTTDHLLFLFFSSSLLIMLAFMDLAGISALMDLHSFINLLLGWPLVTDAR